MNKDKPFIEIIEDGDIEDLENENIEVINGDDMDIFNSIKTSNTTIKNDSDTNTSINNKKPLQSKIQGSENKKENKKAGANNMKEEMLSEEEKEKYLAEKSRTRQTFIVSDNIRKALRLKAITEDIQVNRMIREILVNSIEKKYFDRID